MNEDICLHAINAYYEIYYQKLNLKVLESILKSNALLSRRLQGLESSTGFNGMDYISLCNYRKRNIHPFNHPEYTSYDGYIKESISLMFPKDKLSIINPFILEPIKKNKKGYNRMANLGLNEYIRYSDLPDEVQVKDEISLDLMCGLTLPMRKLDNIFFSIDKNTQKIMKQLNEIKSLLMLYNHLVPIYDIDTMTELTSETEIKKLVKKYLKKI